MSGVWGKIPPQRFDWEHFEGKGRIITMLAKSVFDQQNGDVTKAYYAKMDTKGLAGQLAVALFRAQKRSTAAKRYRGRQFTRGAYDVKNWSLGEVCRILGAMQAFDLAPKWGWKNDPHTPGYTQVLYVDLPTGQCSFHARERLSGPDYAGRWVPGNGSAEAIIAYCDSVWEPSWHGEKPTIEEMRAVREISAAQIEIAL